MASHGQQIGTKRVRFAGLPDVDQELHEVNSKVKGVRNSSPTPHRSSTPALHILHDEALSDYYGNYFDFTEVEELQDVSAPLRQLHVPRAPLPFSSLTSLSPQVDRVDFSRDGLSERQRELRLDKPPERLPSVKIPVPLRSRAPLGVRRGVRLLGSHHLKAEQSPFAPQDYNSDAEDGSPGDERVDSGGPLSKRRSWSFHPKNKRRAGRFNESEDTTSLSGNLPSTLKRASVAFGNDLHSSQSSDGERGWLRATSRLTVAECDDSHPLWEDRAASIATELENSSNLPQTDVTATVPSSVEFDEETLDRDDQMLPSRKDGRVRQAQAAEEPQAAEVFAEATFETGEPHRLSRNNDAWQTIDLGKTKRVFQGGEDSFTLSTKDFDQELAEELRIGVTNDWKRLPLPSFSLDSVDENALHTYDLATQGLTPKGPERLGGRVPAHPSEDPSPIHGSGKSTKVEPLARHETRLELQATVPLRSASIDLGRQPSIPIASEEQEVLPSAPAKTPKAVALAMQLYTTCTELASRLIVFNAPTLWRLPPVPSGMKRIEWICKCGRKLYDDYTELKPGALDSLQLRLNRTSTKRRYPSLGLRLPLSTDSSPHHDDKPNDRTATHSSPQRDHNGSETSHGTIRTALWAAVGKLLSGSEPIEESLPQHSSSNRVEAENFSTDKQISRQIDLQYLLLCVPFKRHASKLLNVNTSTSVTSDETFFQLLRQQYVGHRGRFRHIFSLRGLSEIRFVHFEVFRKNLTDVRSYDCVPPETQKDRYVYSPMPAEYMPPIGVNRMMHLYEHPEDAEDSPMYFPMVPRKLRERLLVSPARRRDEGWGICFVEGLSWSRMCVFGLAGVLATTAFGVAWAVVMDDVQGGFGVASYMLGVLMLGLGALQGAFEM